jgi:glutamate synthase (NADPH/NADH) small chain
VKCLSIFDEQNRFNPRVDESDEAFYPADMVVEAIGQAPDYTFLGDGVREKLDIVRGKIVTDEEGGTELSWLFAGGDIVHGPDVVHAIADGHRSAQAIDAYLTKA